MAKLKVYGFRGWRTGLVKNPNGSPQTREIVATTSKKKVLEILGPIHHMPLSEIEETGNDGEISQAMTEPGIVFFCGIDEPKPKWRRVP